jgi:hypothetical protein
MIVFIWFNVVQEHEKAKSGNLIHQGAGKWLSCYLILYVDVWLV